jgi:hypothetical protein
MAKVCLFLLLIVFVSCKDKSPIGMSKRAIEIKKAYGHSLPIDCRGIQCDTTSVPPNIIQELIDKYHLRITCEDGKWSIIYTDS